MSNTLFVIYRYFDIKYYMVEKPIYPFYFFAFHLSTTTIPASPKVDKANPNFK